MKFKAIKEKSGAYEICLNDEKIFGGIVINGKNQGVGFVGDTKENRYIFEFIEGTFSKSVKVFHHTKDNKIGEIGLGFTDTGRLETPFGKFDWQLLSSSKIWLDDSKNVVMFFDLENNATTSPKVLISDTLDSNTKDLLTLCGWFLIVVEWRAGFSNSTLAGLPVKTDEFVEDNTTLKTERSWFDSLVDVLDAASRL